MYDPLAVIPLIGGEYAGIVILTLEILAVYWQKDLYDQAMSRNGDFCNPMNHREVYHVARSVAKWVWRKFDIEASEASDARFAGRTAQQGWARALCQL